MERLREGAMAERQAMYQLGEMPGEGAPVRAEVVGAGKQQGGAVAPDPWQMAPGHPDTEQPPMVVAATVVAQPGYGGAQPSWPGASPVLVTSAHPASVTWCGGKGAVLKMCVCVMVAFLAGALTFVFLPPVLFGDSDESGPAVHVQTSVAAGGPPEAACPTPSIAHGSLAVGASRDGLPSDGRYYEGTAATVQCDPGFRHRSSGPSILICWLMPDGITAEWSQDLDSIMCESTQPPAPPMVVLEVRTEVYSPDEAARVAGRVDDALKRATVDEETVEVASAITVPVSIDAIADGTPERAQFEASFRQSMATEIGNLDEEAIVVHGIRPGSVVVDWALVAPASVRTQAASLVTTLAASEAGIEVTFGDVTVSADSSTMETPEVWQRSDVDCVGTWSRCVPCTCGACQPRVYTITTTGSGRGDECEAAHGATDSACERFCVDPTTTPGVEEGANEPVPPAQAGDAAYGGEDLYDGDRVDGDQIDHDQTSAEYASTCEQQCLAPGGACAEWGGVLHPCDACIESCSDLIAWDGVVDDATWERYESCEAACHNVGAPCASSPPCTGDGVALTDSGELRHVDGDLLNNQECSWTLTCSQSDTVPYLSFRRFDLEASWDYLYLYDGSSTAGVPAVTLHGTRRPEDIPNFLGAGATVRAHYTSDGSINGGGFEAQFRCVDPSTIPPPPPDPCTTGITLIDRGTLAHYGLDNYQECEWSMRCSEESHSPLVEFSEFNTEANFDFLYLYSGGEADGQADAMLHGTYDPDSYMPYPFLASSNAAEVRYMSDGSVTGDGFAASFECVDASTVPPPPPDPCMETISLIDTGVIEHHQLRAFQDCSWAMSCSNPELSPLIQFETFETEAHFDFLYIYDNSASGADTDNRPVAALHGGSLPLDFLASGPSAVAQYISDVSIDRSGFVASFDCVHPNSVPPPPPDPCAVDPRTGDVIGLDLVDNGEVNHARLLNGQECVWRMSCSNERLLPELVFSTFNTESNYDYLYLYDSENWTDLDQPSLVLHGSSLPRPAVASSNAAVARYVSDSSITADGFTASFSCIDPDDVEGETGLVPDSMQVNWQVCPIENVVLVSNDCNQGEPDWDHEGMICANDGAGDQAYCTYAHSPTSCVYCSEYRDNSNDGLPTPGYYEPDVYQPPGPGFGDDNVYDALALLRVAEEYCPDQYADCEADPVTTGAGGRPGGCIADVMNMIEFSEQPPANSEFALALDQCMQSAIESPEVHASISAIVCGGDACCVCTMGCMDDGECMSSCFDHSADGSPGDCAASLYDDYSDSSDSSGGYSDPCDQCVMECDSMIDWSLMDTSDEIAEEIWHEYQRCTDACYDTQYGACRGMWNEVQDLHPCDACLLGCHEDEPMWLDGEVAIGRPFLLGDGNGVRSHSLAAVAQVVEVAACSSTDWIAPM